MKKLFAILLVLALALGLFCLSAAAAPSAQDMAVLTPYDLAAEPFRGQDGAAMLTLKVDPPDTLPGLDMNNGDDIHLKVEYKLGTGAWTPWFDQGTRRMLEQYQVEPGVFRFPFAWVLGEEWDGAQPVSFRAYCEYMQGGSVATGIISGYSNKAVIAGGGTQTTTKAGKTTAAPKEPRTRTTKPARTAAPPQEPGNPAPAEKSGSTFAVSRAAMLSIGVGVMVLLLLGAALVVIINMKKKK